ncbi:hypothetical protein CLOSTHATH_01738 [Hungatella hathewayi DSM 13479]|uniref:Uncharacterized protein n=1 Tax=Hungatella hathewayi DSM 13479 TaxID=566550 RepID=D3ADQ9_9FIRM|nr:hypothetical protein CLOSTHATH_01738 [Hungatella hathewayi DSM 13479]
MIADLLCTSALIVLIILQGKSFRKQGKKTRATVLVNPMGMLYNDKEILQ